jgi:hypothetical protein
MIAISSMSCAYANGPVVLDASPECLIKGVFEL